MYLMDLIFKIWYVWSEIEIVVIMSIETIQLTWVFHNPLKFWLDKTETKVQKLELKKLP